MSNLVLIDDGGAAATLAPRASFWQSRKCLALTLVLVLLLGSPSLTYPFGRDQGEYAVLAIEEMAGRVIYRDVFNVKPPMTHWLHALALLVFGRSMLADSGSPNPVVPSDHLTRLNISYPGDEKTSEKLSSIT